MAFATRHSAALATTLAAATLLAACGRGASPMGATASSVAPRYNAAAVAERQVVVRLKDSRKLPQTLLRQGRGAPTVTGKIDRLSVVVVQAAPGQNRDELLAQLAKDPAVAYAEASQVVQAEEETSLPNDPSVSKQYSLAITKALQAWAVQPGSKDVVVAIVDSGIDMTHPDLAAKLHPASYNVLDKSNKPTDDHGHGTHCAGIAAAIANNNEGIAGAAPGVGLMAVKVLDARGGGSDVTIAQGVIHAADHGAKVISMSLGLYKRSKVIEDALSYAQGKDVLLVASAGNNNAENDHATKPHLPSTHPGVVEVAATDDKDAKARFSNFGKTVSIAAPGVNIFSTLPTYSVGRDLRYGMMSGTSMAAPFVAGVAGLVRSAFPNLTQAQVKAKLEASADDLGAPGFDPIFGHGRVNVLKAVSPAPAR